MGELEKQIRELFKNQYGLEEYEGFDEDSLLFSFNDFIKVIEMFKKEFLSVDREKPIHEDYWKIFLKWCGGDAK